ncbi:MAG: GNAT family N-acetyltransferase [Acidimicrobiales bacterium]
MDLELRPVAEEEAAAFTRATYVAFGGVPSEESLARAVDRFDADFALAVLDHGRMVATTSAYRLEMTLPAPAGQTMPRVACAGVTAVGVIPTHRRQGLLRRLMDRQLQDLRERGFGVAALLASEATIYGRFGYGRAQLSQALAIERRHAAFTPEAEALAASGRVRIIEPDEAAKVLPSLHDGVRGVTPAEMNRSATWWTWHLKDLERERGGGGARMYAVHESDTGEADGWVSYRVHDSWPLGGVPRWKAVVTDLVAAADATRAALWRLVLNIDLVEEVTAPLVPVDDAVTWLLADSRRARVTEVADHLWLRILDVPKALAARGYGSDERLTIEVTSPDASAAGRFVLETAPTGAACRPARAGEKAQLRLTLADLGAIYLGGVAPSVLARAGRVHELQAGALAAADRVFASPRAPFCSLHF